MTILLTNEAAGLIYQAVSVLHSLASTLTGEAKGELSNLQALLAQTDALPRERIDALTLGLVQVREHLTMSSDEDRIGDGNRVWNVFLAAWALRAPVAADPASGKHEVLERLAYIIECIAQGAHGSAKDEMESISKKLKSDARYLFPGSDRILVDIESVHADYLIFDRGRDSLNRLCKINRALWASVLQP